MADQRWCLADSPHTATGGFTVGPGVTLTIEAGVSVTVEGTMTVQGTLLAQGTPDLPVTFSNWRWTGLVFSGGVGTLSYCKILNGGFNTPALWATDVAAPGLVLDHCTFDHGSDVVLTGSRVAIRDSSFTNISGAYPLRIQGASSAVSLAGNTFTNNQFNRIAVETGAMTEADFALTAQEGLEGYELGGDYTVPSGRTATFGAGVSVVVNGRLSVLGRLVTEGTGGRPVSITNGWRWTGILFDGGTGDLSHCIISNAGFDSPGVKINNVTTGEVRFEGCRITGSQSVIATGSRLVLVNTVISDARSESLWGLVAEGASTLTATHCTIARCRNGVSLLTGSTGTFTNTIVANTGTGVEADGTSHGTMRGTLWDTVAVQAPGDIAQEGSVTGAAAFESDGCHITPASAALGQGVLTSVRDDMDGDSRPSPVTSFPDLGADESPYEHPSSRSPVALTLGQAALGQMTCGRYGDFQLDLAEGQAPNLVVRLSEAAGSPSWSLVAREGLLGTETVYDVRATRTPDGALELVIPAPHAGRYFFTALCEGSGSGTFTLRAVSAERHLAAVTPASGGNAGTVTVKVLGVGFADGLVVELRNGPVLRRAVPGAWDDASLTTRFDLRGLSAQAADLAVRWPDGGEEVLSGAFAIVQGGSADLKAKIIVPAAVRGMRSATIWLEYENVGAVDMDAPLFVISSDQSLAMRHTPYETWRREPLTVLGIDRDNAGHAGTLSPAHPQRVPLRVLAEGAAHSRITFSLSVLSPEAGAVDWAAQEASMRPDGVEDALWSRLWPALTAAFGPSWPGIQSSLRQAADYLSAHGRFEHRPSRLQGLLMDEVMGNDVSAMLAFERDALCPAPGRALVFDRTHGTGLLARFHSGPLGYGWSHSYDLRLQELPSGDVFVRAGSALRPFMKLSSGAYQGHETDQGKLRKDGEDWVLTEPDGTRMRFDAEGALHSVTDAAGNVVTLSYDASGRLESVQHSSGDRFAFAYDDAGRIAELTDHAGEKTRYAYDGGGCLEIVTTPDGRTTHYAYHAEEGKLTDHALVATTHPDGRVVTFLYDDLGRFSGRRSPGGAATFTFARTALGTTAVSDPMGHTATLCRDEAGRLVEASAPGLPSRGLAYDDAGNLSEVNYGDRKAAFTWGPLGEPLSVKDPAGNTTAFAHTYPAAGGSAIESFSDAGGVTYSVERSASAARRPAGSEGLANAVVYPDGTREEFLRDAQGLVTQYTNRRGQAVAVTRNVRGQVTSASFPDGTSANYEYDSAGRLTKAGDASGDILLRYDAAGNLAQITYPGGHTFTFAYDAAGRRTQRTSEDGFTLNYAYDAEGRLANVTTGEGTLVMALTCDASGRVTREDRGNGTATTFTRDASGRLLQIRHLAPGGAESDFALYAYDAAGNVASKQTPHGTESYEYDAAGRLLHVAYPGGHSEGYTYDGAGNRVVMERDGQATYYLVNGLNQVESAGNRNFGYDRDGNMSSASTGSGTASFQYDALGRLVAASHPSAGGAAYTYNALGQMASVASGGATLTFLYDGAGTLPAAELAGAGVAAARNVDALGLAARIAQDGAASFFHFDGSGNTTQVTGTSGSVTNTYGYSPFGETRESTGAGSNAYRYGGQEGTRLDAGGMDGLLDVLGSRSFATSLGRTSSAGEQRFSEGPNPYSFKGSEPITGAPQFEPTVSDHSILGDVLTGTGTLLGLPELGKAPNYKVHLGLEPAEVPGFSTHVGNALNIYAGFQGLSEMQSATERHDTGAYIHGTTTMTLAGLGMFSAVCPPLAVPVFIAGFVQWGADTATDIYISNLHTNDPSHWYVPHSFRYYKMLNERRMMPPESQRSPMGQSDPSEVKYSEDPNEKVGPAGRGEQHIVLAQDTLSYTLHFENVATASAPAQEVFVTDALDASLDPSTLRFGDAGWGDQIVSVTSEAPAFHLRSTVPDYRPGVSKVWWVDLYGELAEDGTLRWILRTLDPATGDLPEDALAGFLPPNDASGRGEGYVSFTIKARAGTPLGTVIRNTGTILFDQNAPIVTNTVSNTIGLPCSLACDAAAPAGASAGQAVAFTGSASGPWCAGSPVFDWNFGDGSTHSSEQNPSHVYAAAGAYHWSLGVTAEDQVCSKSGTVTVVNPPVITLVKKASPPFKLVVTGSNLQNGIRVFIDGTEWTSVVWKNPGKIQLTGAVKAAVPKGTTHTFRFLNPDGGEATTTWGW